MVIYYPNFDLSYDPKNVIYTHLDPSITKQDILKLYDELYPEF